LDLVLSIDWNPREHYQDPAVAEAYDRTRFNSLAGRVFNSLEKRALVRSLSGLPTGAHIIDIPCGTGRLAQVLLEAGYRVTGCDISQAMLNEAARKLARFGSRFTCRVGDAERLPPPETPFAAAVSARILMHLPLNQQIEFLRNVSSQTDGRVVFNQSYNSRYQHLRRLFKRLLHHRTPVQFPLTEAEIHRLLHSAGLREIKRFWTAPGISEGFFLVATKQ
jgi:ubiquinone/menaquinone biosynthesis C-methylase UbiE